MNWKKSFSILLILVLIFVVFIIVRAQESTNEKVVYYPGEIKGSESGLSLLYHFNNESRFENDTYIHDFSGDGHYANAEIKMEMGTTGDTIASSWFTVRLQNNYNDPIVIAEPLSYDGADVSVIRIKNITQNSFEVRVQEAPNYDDSHTTETINYIVIEKGAWRLDDGTKIEAGKIVTNATSSGENATFQNWEQIAFSHSYSSNPIVLSQVMTYNDSNFVKTREIVINTTTFNVTMEEQGNSTTSHGTETIGWIAVESGTGIIDEGNYSFHLNSHYEFNNTPDAVQGLDDGVGWYRQAFTQSFSYTPLFIGWMQTYDGSDSSEVRYKDLDSSGVNLTIEEDTTSDADQSHTTEVVGYLAFGNPNVLTSYHLDYGSGSTIIDSTPSDNNGDIYGATWTTDSKFGGHALYFDGVDDYVALPVYYASTNIDPFTVTAWVKVPSNGGDWSIVDFDRSEYYTCAAGINGSNYEGEGGYIGFHTANSSGDISDMWSNFNEINDSTWHHVAWVFNGSTKFIYIDGNLDSTQNIIGGIGTGVTRYGFLGDGSEATTMNGSRNGIYYEGYMDEVRIYKRVLSQREIRQLITNSPHSLIVFDRPKFNNSDNGKLGKGAFEFYGIPGSYLAINKCYGANSISEITVCAWVKSNSSENQIIASFDRSENWRLALNDDVCSSVGWDTIDAASTQNDLCLSTNYADGNWHYICGWFKAGSSPDKKIYVDGEVKNSTTAHGGNNLGEGQERTCTYGFVGVGSEAEDFDGKKGPLYWFDGKIDDFVIYNRSLSDTEIYNNYIKGLSCHYNGEGDWIVNATNKTSRVICEGSEVTININGDIYIYNMTTLKLNNTLLKFNSTPSKIHIKKGGRFGIVGKLRIG